MEKQKKSHPVLSVKDVLLIIVAALLVIVIFQNIKPHVYQIFFWKVALSPVLLSLIMAGMGFLVGYYVAKRCLKTRAEKDAAKTAPPAPPAAKPPAGDNRPLA